MVKMNKEYSDAFGFRLLGHFNAFIAEYPEKGNQIQSICDEDFKATCIKCYPIILSAGIDPAKYSPPVAAASASIRSTLREMFPIKDDVIDLEIESDGDEPQSPEVLKCPENSPKTPKSSPKKKEPMLKNIEVSCFSCSRLAKELEQSKQNTARLETENQRLRKIISDKNMDLNALQDQLKASKYLYAELLNETKTIREDLAYADKQYFDYLKRRKLNK